MPQSYAPVSLYINGGEKRKKYRSRMWTNWLLVINSVEHFITSVVTQ